MKSSRGALYRKLQNRIYRGDITHKGDAYPGEHPAIIEKVLWDEVQAVLTQNRLLLYSADGGETWTELLHAGAGEPTTAGAKLLGFALSPDGSTVLAVTANRFWTCDSTVGVITSRRALAMAAGIASTRNSDHSRPNVSNVRPRTDPTSIRGPVCPLTGAIQAGYWGAGA